MSSSTSHRQWRTSAEEAARYSLFIQKQPGTGDIPLSLSLSLPEGAKPLSLQLDGKPVSGDGWKCKRTSRATARSC